MWKRQHAGSAAMVLVIVVSAALAQSGERGAPGQASDDPPGKQNGAAAEQGATDTPKQPPSAEDVIQDLLRQREQPPVVEPSVGPSDDRPPATAPQLDPRVIGVAPDGPAPKLRREGEFIVARTGRLVRAPGSQSIFAFDADSAQAAEPPVFLMPCQMLQNMETIVQERGDQVKFILSGQVFTYRGANYLLPTMMKLAVERGNLER